MDNGSYQEASAHTGAVSILNFEQAAIALNDIIGGGEERYRDPSERYVDELLRPDRALPPEVRKRLKAEGHQRLASPLYPLPDRRGVASGKGGSGRLALGGR